MPGHSMGHAECTGETDKSIWVVIDDLDTEEAVSVPKSQIHDDSEVWKRDQTGELVVTAWLARERGWV